MFIARLCTCGESGMGFNCFSGGDSFDFFFIVADGRVTTEFALTTECS